MIPESFTTAAGPSDLLRMRDSTEARLPARTRLLTGFSSAVLLLACGGEDVSQSSKQALRVAAAANVRPAIERIADQFREAHPDVDLSITYGSSGSFHAQIVHGAPFDLFLSADTRYPAELVEELDLQAEPFRYAKGRIVAWVRSDSPLDLDRGLEVVRADAVKKISIANPNLAPYGTAAVDVFRNHGLLEVATPKLILATNVVEALQFADSGAAELGVVALSLVRSPNMENIGRWRLIEENHAPILQDGLVLPGPNQAQAGQFRDWLTGARGREVLESMGFETGV